MGDEYLPPQSRGLIWGHDEGELGIEVCVGDSPSNGGKRSFHACCKMLQCAHMLDEKRNKHEDKKTRDEKKEVPMGGIHSVEWKSS